MYAFPPNADIAARDVGVSFGPRADIPRCAAENKQFRHNYATVRWKSLLGFCVGGAFADIAPDCTYGFYRLAETGALSLAGIQHAGRDTDDYPSDEVQDMAQQIASGHASVHFGPFQDEEEVNRVHWRSFATQAKREPFPPA